MGVLVFQLTLLTKKKNRYKIGFGPWVIVCWLLFLWTSLVSILHLSTPVVIFPSQKGMASCKHIKWVHSFVCFFCFLFFVGFLTVSCFICFLIGALCLLPHCICWGQSPCWEHQWAIHHDIHIVWILKVSI